MLVVVAIHDPFAGCILPVGVSSYLGMELDEGDFELLIKCFVRGRHDCQLYCPPRSPKLGISESLVREVGLGDSCARELNLGILSKGSTVTNRRYAMFEYCGR